MDRIELYIDGELADYPKAEFILHLQANNLFNFDTREFTFVETINLPSTPKNRQIFNFPEIVNNLTSGAYKKYNVEIRINGLPIIAEASGFLMSMRGNYYLFNIIENSRDIYMSLVGKTMRDLPLHTLQHDKDIATIKEQWDNNADVIYAIADYGGATITNGAYNFDYCPPAIKMDWILQQIKKLKDPSNPYIFESAFFDSPFWKSLYMTISDVKIHDINTGELIFEKSGGCTSPAREVEYNVYYNDDTKQFEKGNVSFFTIEEAGDYVINIKGSIRGVLYLVETDQHTGKVKERAVHLGGFGGYEDIHFENILFSFVGGEKLYLRAVGVEEQEDRTGQGGILVQAEYTEINFLEVKIQKAKQVELTELVSNLSLLDWFKEVTRLFSLTPLKDNKYNNIQQFYTLQERLQAPELDWSDKFIKVKEHRFRDVNAYSQANKFTFKKYYENTTTRNENENDYNLLFTDEGLTPEKEFKSKFYLGIDRNFSDPAIRKRLDTIEFYTKEIKETPNKAVSIEYKPKSNRFHLFQAQREDIPINYALNNSEETGRMEYGVFSDIKSLKWGSLHNEFYKDLPKLMDRMHYLICEFNLSELDIYQFSFYSRIYVEKLGGYFLPNKITYQKGTIAIVELINIK